MKLLEYKQFNNADEEKRLNPKKVAVVIIIAIIIFLISAICIAYICSSSFRNFMDKYVLMKSLTENSVPYISIDSEKNIYVYAYHNYIAILNNNSLELYNSSGNKEETLQVNISSPIFDSTDKYCVIAEEGKQKVYLIKDKKIFWEKDIEGQISRINVNKNGYVSVIVSGTSYKSVITTFDANGDEIFKTFISSNLVVDVDISDDNKYLSFCEVDISGALSETTVKTISIEKAMQTPKDSIIYTYKMPSNTLITDIEYHSKDELICMMNTQICSLKDGNINVITNLQNSSTTFAGIKLNKSFFKVIEHIQGINNQTSNVEIYNTSSKSSHLYIVNGIPKEVYSADGVIAINLGTEVYFVNENGWLIKKYSSHQEIKNIVISGNIAGIVYRNKIYFINL